MILMILGLIVSVLSAIVRVIIFVIEMLFRGIVTLFTFGFRQKKNNNDKDYNMVLL